VKTFDVCFKARIAAPLGFTPSINYTPIMRLRPATTVPDGRLVVPNRGQRAVPTLKLDTRVSCPWAGYTGFSWRFFRLMDTNMEP
jgi:hypothetical protein